MSLSILMFIKMFSLGHYNGIIVTGMWKLFTLPNPFQQHSLLCQHSATDVKFFAFPLIWADHCVCRILVSLLSVSQYFRLEIYQSHSPHRSHTTAPLFSLFQELCFLHYAECWMFHFTFSHKNCSF